jgi:hypothetical protein
MQQRLSSLAVRRFVKNEENFSDDDLLKMVNNQEIEMTRKDSNELNCSVITDEEYFDRLSSSLDQYSGENQFYFKDLKDFALKSQSNNYQRLLLSETPSPKSSNQIFKESTFEKFDVSDKYSYMKLASTIKPNLKSNLTTFISPKKSEQFYNQHRYLINYSPPLLIQTLQQNVRNNSNKNINLTNTNYIQKRSLIDSKSSFKHSIQL